MAYYLVDDKALVELCDGETLWKLASGEIQLAQVVTCCDCAHFASFSGVCECKGSPTDGEQVRAPGKFFCGFCTPKPGKEAWQ